MARLLDIQFSTDFKKVLMIKQYNILRVDLSDLPHDDGRFIECLEAKGLVTAVSSYPYSEKPKKKDTTG